MNALRRLSLHPLQWVRQVARVPQRLPEDGLDPGSGPPPLSLDALLAQPNGALDRLVAAQRPELSEAQWLELEARFTDGGDDPAARRAALSSALATLDPAFGALHARLSRAHRFLGLDDFPAPDAYASALERFHSLVRLERAAEGFLESLDARGTRGVHRAAAAYDDAVQRYNHQTGASLPRLLVRGGLLEQHLKKADIQFDAEERVTEVSLRGMDRSMLRLMLAVSLSSASTMLGMYLAAGQVMQGSLQPEELRDEGGPLASAALVERLQQDFGRWNAALDSVEAALGSDGGEGEFWFGALHDEEDGTRHWGSTR